MTSEMTTNNSSIKRRKTDGSVVISLMDLPIGILEHTAGFLAAPSRALFAVALSNNENNNPPGENYSSIAGNDWGTLDFGEIEKDLAARLSDDDVSSILQHIDAVNTVKRLRLTNCIKISGICVEPLRGSTIIEKIDLSLVADGENPKLDPDPPILSEFVLPILDSIIEREDCALKYLELPNKWKSRDRSNDSEFHAFIVRYNEMREIRGPIRCLNCNEGFHRYRNQWIEWIGRGDDEDYGLQNYTCSQCTKHYCYDCYDEDNREQFFRHCTQCRRDYCKDCTSFYWCKSVYCGDIICENCAYAIEQCDKCDGKLCSGCAERCPPTVCVYCDLSYCDDCNDGVDRMRICDQCSKSCCNSCRLQMCRERISDCDGCIKALPHNTLVAQIRSLQEEMGRLKNEVSELKLENKELKDKA